MDAVTSFEPASVFFSNRSVRIYAFEWQIEDGRGRDKKGDKDALPGKRLYFACGDARF